MLNRITKNRHRICKTRSERESQQIINNFSIKFELRFRFEINPINAFELYTYVYKFNEANLINAWNIYYIQKRPKERSMHSNNRASKIYRKSDFDLKNEMSMQNPFVELSREHVARLCFATN